MEKTNYNYLHIFFLKITVYSYNRTPDNDYLDFSHSVPLYLLMGFFYLGGLAIYLVRCPERFRPGVFDIWVKMAV